MCGQRPYRSRQPAHPRSPRQCSRFSFVPALVRSVSRQNLLLRFGLVGKRERTALRKVLPFGLSLPWDKLSQTCLKEETPGPYVWPVKRQQVAARCSPVLCGGPERQAASLSLADRGRGAGKLPTRGGGVGRSSSRKRSHSAPAARLPAFTRGRPLCSCGEEKTSSHIPPEKRSKWRGGQEFFCKYFFMLFRPPRTDSRTELLSTPSAWAISR